MDFDIPPVKFVITSIKLFRKRALFFNKNRFFNELTGALAEDQSCH
ncbi:hypothetical protein ACFVSS_18830 [Peribacillus butanolivorans]